MHKFIKEMNNKIMHDFLTIIISSIFNIYCNDKINQLKNIFCKFRNDNNHFIYHNSIFHIKNNENYNLYPLQYKNHNDRNDRIIFQNIENNSNILRMKFNKLIYFNDNTCTLHNKNNLLYFLDDIIHINYNERFLYWIL